jgi:hypothetical protein
LEAAKDVVQRVGSRGSAGIAVAGLCRRLTPSLLAPEHIAELLGQAEKVGARDLYQLRGQKRVRPAHMYR